VYPVRIEGDRVIVEVDVDEVPGSTGFPAREA